MVYQLKNRNQRFSHSLKVIGALAGLFLVIWGAPALANHLTGEIRQTQNELNQKRAEASSLQGQINSLSSSITQLQKEIEATDHSITETNARIEELKAEIERQKGILADVIRDLYSKGQISSLEMLASSETFVEFLNKTEYLDQAQQSIQTTLEKITKMKDEAEQKKIELEALRVRQTGQKTLLNNQLSERRHLLSATQSQAKLINQELQSLYAAQAAENISRSKNNRYGGTGGYPWAGACLNNFPCYQVDSYGYYVRQCTSYAAWKWDQLGNWGARERYHWGTTQSANGKDWVRHAINAGYPVDGSPRVGDIAVSQGGPYGHVMIVKSLPGGGLVTVSQYNYGYNGVYSEGEWYISGLSFIHPK